MNKKLFILPLLAMALIGCGEGGGGGQGGGGQGGGGGGQGGGGDSGDTITVARALEIIGGLADGGVTSEEYTVGGYVSTGFAPKESSSTKGTWNFDMADTADGSNKLIVWYASATTAPVQGKKINVKGKLTKYKDKSGNVKSELTDGTVTWMEDGQGGGGGGGQGGDISTLTSVVKIDFSSTTARNGSGENGRLTTSEIASFVKDNAKTSGKVTDATGENVYQGYVPNSGDTSAYKDGVDGCLRMGGSKKTGTLTITASESIKGVRINAHAWKTDTISVNGATAVSMTLNYANYDFVFTAGTSITISTTNRAFIASIELFK